MDVDMQKKEPEKYKEKFYKEFGFFIKEGICQDYARQGEIIYVQSVVLHTLRL